MSIKAVVRLADEFAVEAFFAPARFISSHKQDRPALRVEGEGYSPFAALKRSSFMFAWREPLSVSTRGRPNCGPNCSQSSDNARISVRTCSGSASNSGSNSSPISTAYLTRTNMAWTSYDVSYISFTEIRSPMFGKRHPRTFFEICYPGKIVARAREDYPLTAEREVGCRVGSAVCDSSF
jgi:hypothetical protein